MQGNDKKMEKLQKIKELWNELRDKEEEVFSENTVFIDRLMPKINMARKEILIQLTKSLVKIREIGLREDLKNIIGLKLNYKVDLNKVEDILIWRQNLKANLKILKEVSQNAKYPSAQNLMDEANFNIILSSAIENDFRFYDLRDKAFFSNSASIQKHIVTDANKLEIEIEGVKEEFLNFSIKAQEHLTNAIAEMKAAVLALDIYEMDDGLKHQLKALEELDSLGEMINKSMQKQKNISSSKKSGSSGPKSFGAQTSGASGSLDKSGVKLPKEGDYNSSKEIREKVMESLKENYPQKSKETILDYLRKISE